MGREGRPPLLGHRRGPAADSLPAAGKIHRTSKEWAGAGSFHPGSPRRKVCGKGYRDQSGGRSVQRHDRSACRASGTAWRIAARHERGIAHCQSAMNLTRALDVALPDIPARTISQRQPRIDPGATFREHIEDGQPMVRVYVPSSGFMYTMSRSQWALAQLFDGNRSAAQIAEM